MNQLAKRISLLVFGAVPSTCLAVLVFYGGILISSFSEDPFYKALVVLSVVGAVWGTYGLWVGVLLLERITAFAITGVIAGLLAAGFWAVSLGFLDSEHGYNFLSLAVFSGPLASGLALVWIYSRHSRSA